MKKCKKRICDTMGCQGDCETEKPNLPVDNIVIRICCKDINWEYYKTVALSQGQWTCPVCKLTHQVRFYKDEKEMIEHHVEMQRIKNS